MALVVAVALAFGFASGSESADGVAATPVPPLPATAIATPVAATPGAHAALPPRAALSEGALEGAWRRYGCQVNPGNPTCLTVTLAADCLGSPASSACAVDRDGDRCTDVSEVLAGFDPFDGADCLSNRAGAPAINCLFPAGNLPCNEIPGITTLAPADGCAVEAAVERTLHPGNPSTCASPAPSAVDCAFFDRDPACDGFSPRRE